MMDKSEQARRYYQWKDYQQKNEGLLMAFAHTMGIDEERSPREFILAEAFSRALGAKVLLHNYPRCTIVAKPLYHHYDFDLIDEDGNVRGVECKFRLNDKDEYTTDDISLSKKDYLATTSEEKPIDLLYMFYDGNVRVYDINGPSTTSTWTHRMKTAVDSETITDECLKFNKWDNLWTTTVSVPL